MSEVEPVGHTGRKTRGRKMLLTLYGNVAIPRVKCPRCDSWALVIDGKSACCEADVQNQETARHYRRMSEPVFNRKQPGKEDQQAILECQDHRCIYCGRAFGGHYSRNGKERIVRLVWDHFLPFSMTGNNYPYNFVAACSLCNGIKCDKVFQTIDEARVYIQSRTATLGVEVA